MKKAELLLQEFDFEVYKCFFDNSRVTYRLVWFPLNMHFEFMDLESLLKHIQYIRNKEGGVKND